MLVFSEEIDPLRVVRGYDAFDVEALGKETAFGNTGCAGAGRGRKHLR